MVMANIASFFNYNDDDDDDDDDDDFSDNPRTTRERHPGLFFCLEYNLVLFNLIILIATIVLIVFVLKSLRNKIAAEPADEYKLSAEIGILIVVIITCVIVFLGCAGAWCGWYELLFYYGILLTIFVVVQVSFLIAIFMMYRKPTFQETVDRALMRLMKAYFFEGASKIAMDNIQIQFQCCGVYGPKDWKTIPDSCCDPYDYECSFESSYKEGCSLVITQFIRNSYRKLAIVAMVLISIELMAAMTALVVRGYSKAPTPPE